MLTNFGEIRSPGKGPQQAITAQQQLEFIFPLGEPGHDLSGDHLLSRFTAKTDFLVHQPDRFLRAQFGILLQEFFNGDLLTRAQAAAIARTWRETHSLSGPRQRTELVRAGLNDESTGSAVSQEEGGGMGHSSCGAAVPGEVPAVLRGTASRRASS